MFRNALLVVLAGITFNAAAADMPRLDQRQENQLERIHSGVRSGDLTRVETRQLLHSQARLERHEQLAEADGTVTQRERARLFREADHASGQIARQRHDRQRH